MFHWFLHSSAGLNVRWNSSCYEYQSLKATLEWKLTWKFENSVPIHGKMAAIGRLWRIGQKWVSIQSILQLHKCQIFPFNNAWNVSVFGVFLVRIFSHLDWIRRDIPHLSVFSPNVGKYRPEKHQIRILFTQCNILRSVQQWTSKFRQH